MDSRVQAEECVVVTTSSVFADTPEAAYVAVIFTSVRTEGDQGYAAMSARMAQLAAEQPGYLGVESARDRIGITVSYWRDEMAAKGWKAVAEHVEAQLVGREVWYADYGVRIATVVCEYDRAQSGLTS